MKTSIKLLALGAVLGAGILTLHAADKKDLGGPKGGRLLERTEPKAEFFLEKDRTVTVAFYDGGLKPIAVGSQSVTVIANAKGGKKTIELEKKGDSLVGKSKLPDGEGYNVVVQFKQTADAKPQNFRFKLDLATCGECKRAEYACICGH